MWWALGPAFWRVQAEVLTGRALGEVQGGNERDPGQQWGEWTGAQGVCMGGDFKVAEERLGSFHGNWKTHSAG